MNCRDRPAKPTTRHIVALRLRKHGCAGPSEKLPLGHRSTRGRDAGKTVMTNAIAILLVLMLGGILALDALFLGWDIPVFVGRKLILLLEALAVWR